MLELFAYEVHAEVHRASPHAVKYKNIHTTRLMTVLISALGKLGAVTFAVKIMSPHFAK